MKSLEMQVGQLANEMKNQSKRKFPSDMEQNPRDQCKAIILRSGKEVDLSKPKEVKNKEVEVEVEVEVEEEALQSQVPSFSQTIHQSFLHHYSSLNAFRRRNWTISSPSV